MAIKIGTKHGDRLIGQDGQANLMDGLGGNDTLIGGNIGDALLGSGGNDLIEGNGGDDLLQGGGGKDTLSGGDGNDVVFGQGGNDVMSGGAGADNLRGNHGNDVADGGAGNDVLLGGLGNDLLVGGEGNDTLKGGDGNDTLDGGANDDSLSGGAGNDLILAGSGNNTIRGGEGNDTIIGGDGSDRIVWTVGGGSDTVIFGTGSSTLVLDNFPGVGVPGSDWSVTLPTGGSPGLATFTYLPTGDVITVNNWQNGHSTVICFYPGTAIATPEGVRAVESLSAGDLVLTAEGRAAPVRWMGRQTVSTRFGDPLSVLPIRIQAGALAEGLPQRDLLVSPAHALLIEGVLVQAGALVNGTTITRESAVPEVFTYFHVELAGHDLVLAEGVPAETFVDTVERGHFDNPEERPVLAEDNAPIAEMDLPRAKAHRQVPQAVRDSIAARAVLLLPARDAA